MLALLLAALATPVVAGEWTHWRGPWQTGIAQETDLPTSWSKTGENLIWRDDFVGRSTPVVFDGRVCANGRVGEDITRQETVVCWNAETGERVWERRFNIYNTTVPWNRVGWAGLAADPETGYVYYQGVDGHIAAFDRDGKTVWSWRTFEDLGRFSGYGGRTNTPVIDNDQVIYHLITAGWGPMAGPGDRYVGFDKKTGEIHWHSPKGKQLKDLNTYSVPVVAVVEGRRLVIGGGADGWLRAVDIHTGEEIWSYHLSQRGLNASVVVDGTTVFASHSEENVDNGVMGRVVAIDATGSGDVSKTHELWRKDEILAGYASPLFHDGVLYVPDNSANLHAFDAKSGKALWEFNYGTVGKGSPVFADGRIYLTETNGNTVFVEASRNGAEKLDDEHLEMPYGRYAEIYSSFAPGYQRLYFTTEEGVYAIGDKDVPFAAGGGAEVYKRSSEAPADAKPAHLQVVPAMTVVDSTDSVDFRARLFDDQGRFLREVEPTWALSGVAGAIDATGVATFDSAKIAGTRNGLVTATFEGIEGKAGVRVEGPLPWSFDFEDMKVDDVPRNWMGVGKGAKVGDLEGNKVLVQPKAARGAPRASIFLGPSSMTGYTIQADFMGNQERRRRTDAGLINSGYTMDVQGVHQRIQVRSWASELRMKQDIPFEWESKVWYTGKLRVDYEGDKAIVRGKVWKQGDAEPADWTFEVEDPLPIRSGSPGLYTFAPLETYFDNIVVTEN
ncbi:MAG: PQQ-binding-like beta-propeller repeat protein [Acidobacteriota bacterium]